MANEEDAASKLPIGLWITIHLFSDDGAIGGHSMGLSAYTGYEIEISALPWPAEDIYQRLAGIIRYLFIHGPVLKGG